MATSENAMQGVTDTADRNSAETPRNSSRRTWARRHRVLAVALSLISVGIVAVAILLYQHWAGDAKDIVSIELAGQTTTISDTVREHGTGGLYRHALIYDAIVIAGYLIGFVLANLIALQAASTAFGRRIFGLAIGAVVAAALLDAAEDLTLWQTLPTPVPSDKNWAIAAAACAFAKFVLLIPAAIVGAIAVLTILWRGALRPLTEFQGRKSQLEALRTETDPKLPATDVDEGLAAAADQSAGVQRAAWRANSNLPGVGRQQQQLGFCVSGGGIRSATFALGALSTLRLELLQARYLVSVSGGGYATGALRLALQDLREREQTWHSSATAADVFMPGSPELQHTRRHGRYLADGAAEWLRAVGTIVRGVLVNLLIIGVVVVLSARLLAHAYASFPHADSVDSVLQADHFRLQPGVGWAAALPAVLALLLWAFNVLAEPQWVALRQRLRQIALGALALAIAVTAFGVVIPLLAFACSKAPSSGTLTGTGVPISSAGGLLAAFLALGTNPNSRKKALADANKVVTFYGKASGKRRGIAARAGMLIGGLVLVAGLLLLFGVVLASTGAINGHSHWPGHVREYVFTAVFGAVLLFFLGADQVRWSLHPFYRRRLSTAFAVRRLRAGGAVKSAAYRYEELTPLASTDKPGYATSAPDFPQVIFACSAHVSGQQLTPPGRQVLGWTMAADYLGSPLLGWVNTGGTYNGVSPTIQRDLTVEAAQAISGAAIASQMGRMQAGYTRLLTLTNVRLGSWLPNPAYIGQLKEHDTSWWLSRIPRRRYLATLAKELFGHYPADAPLIYVTDGGHYDNLGLIELLRHRCEQIVCIDASGDSGDVAATLAQAVQLAYEELGVVIELDDPGQLTSENKQPATPSALITALGARVKRSCVVTGRITYPPLGPDLPAATGKLVLGKAVLTADAPFDVLAYASGDVSFPNDSTADQWYDADRFDSYHALGRFVGKQVGTRFEWLTEPGTAPWPPPSSEPVMPSPSVPLQPQVPQVPQLSPSLQAETRPPSPSEPSYSTVLIRFTRRFLNDGSGRGPYRR
jgi:hypothetical protein